MVMSPSERKKKWVRSPVTHRPITVGGSTYLEIKGEGGSPARELSSAPSVTIHHGSPASKAKYRSLAELTGEEKWIRSPVSHHLILKGGPTYEELQAKGKSLSHKKIVKGKSKKSGVWVKSPKTGRPVKKGSDTYMELEQEGYKMSKAPRKYTAKEHTPPPKMKRPSKSAPLVTARYGTGRGSASRGWKALAPRTTADRIKVAETCGRAKCFLGKGVSFPICPKCGPKSCSCKRMCIGIKAAKARAAQTRHPAVYKKASKLYLGCGAKTSSPYLGGKVGYSM